jgi:hypothetical protein
LSSSSPRGGRRRIVRSLALSRRRRYNLVQLQKMAGEEGLLTEKGINRIVIQIKAGKMNLVGAIKPLLLEIAVAQGGAAGDDAQGVTLSPPQRKMLEKVLRPFFTGYTTKKNAIAINELNRVFMDMGEKKNAKELNEMFRNFDKDGSGFIEFPEFVDGVVDYVFKHEHLGSVARESIEHREEEGDGDEDEEEVPSDLQGLTPEQQQRAVIWRSAWMCSTGTGIIILFSDAIVDVLDEFGTRAGIPAFYVAFVLAPLVTNGSELLASYTFAAKKTSPSICNAFEQLLGGAVMNNTFCTGIFLALIYFQARSFFSFLVSSFDTPPPPNQQQLSRPDDLSNRDSDPKNAPWVSFKFGLGLRELHRARARHRCRRLPLDSPRARSRYLLRRVVFERSYRLALALARRRPARASPAPTRPRVASLPDTVPTLARSDRPVSVRRSRTTLRSFRSVGHGRHPPPSRVDSIRFAVLTHRSRLRFERTPRQDLEWTFTAETLAIIVVEVLMIFFALKRVSRVWDGVCAFLLYPIALGMVAFLEAKGVN